MLLIDLYCDPSSLSKEGHITVSLSNLPYFEQYLSCSFPLPSGVGTHPTYLFLAHQPTRANMSDRLTRYDCFVVHLACFGANCSIISIAIVNNDKVQSVEIHLFITSSTGLILIPIRYEIVQTQGTIYCRSRHITTS